MDQTVFPFENTALLPVHSGVVHMIDCSGYTVTGPVNSVAGCPTQISFRLRLGNDRRALNRKGLMLNLLFYNSLSIKEKKQLLSLGRVFIV